MGILSKDKVYGGIHSKIILRHNVEIGEMIPVVHLDNIDKLSVHRAIKADTVKRLINESYKINRDT